MTLAERAAVDLCIMVHRQDPDRPRRALDGLYLCHGHRAELERLVTELPDHADDLDRATTPGSNRGNGDHGLVIDLRAAEHRSHIAAVAASWCRVVAEDHAITPPASAGLHHTIPWLLPHLDWCAAQRWVDEMLTELRQATGRAMAIVDIPARTVRLGARCLRHADGERCTGAVSIVVRGDEWTAHCDTCRLPHEATPYLRDAKPGQWITADGVIRLAMVFGLPCSEEVVRQWRHRRRITGKDDGQRVWYDLASVQTYLTRRTSYGASHGR